MGRRMGDSRMNSRVAELDERIKRLESAQWDFELNVADVEALADHIRDHAKDIVYHMSKGEYYLVAAGKPSQENRKRLYCEFMYLGENDE